MFDDLVIGLNGRISKNHDLIYSSSEYLYSFSF